uniref:Uncharacterized protein n=1 Tax=Amphimedon queenslandica TaxID=400682 RepID=A0A1X7V287_AMPQE
MPYNVPKLNRYVRVKEAVFKRMIRELIQLGPDLHGYRVEYQFRGRVQLRQIIELAKTADGSLPPGVTCKYHLEDKTYCRFIQSYYRHCVRNGLFTGVNTGLVTMQKKRMLFCLYNTIGIWSYIMAPYVTPVDAVNLPPLIKAFLRAPSSAPYFPERAGLTKTRVDPSLEESVQRDRNTNSNLLQDIKEHLLVKRHFGKKGTFCAERNPRGVTRCFKSKQELYLYVYTYWGKKWRKELKHT